MFARVLEMKAKRGQAHALCAVIEKKGMAACAKYAGFVDGLALIAEENPETVLAMSFWKNREAAEKFRTEGYETVADAYRPFLEGEIHVRGFDVPLAGIYKAKAA